MYEEKVETKTGQDKPRIELCNGMDLPVFDVHGPNEDRINLESLLRPDNIFEIGYSKVVDTVQDINVIIKRATTARKSEKERKAELRDKRRRVVLVGSGWGAHALTKILDDDEVEVIVVSPRR